MGGLPEERHKKDRGRRIPLLRWDDCRKRDIRRADEEETSAKMGELPEERHKKGRGRRRPLLRWEDCRKRDIRKAEEEEDLC